MQPHAFCFVVLIACCCPVGPAAEPVDFSHDVLPILKSRCADCHTEGTYEGGVSFDTREALLGSAIAIPGNAAGSELIYRVTNDDPDLRMPPDGDPLTAEEVAVLRRWIEQGHDAGAIDADDRVLGRSQQRLPACQIE